MSDVIERRHGVHVEIRRLPLSQFDAGDAQGPDVNFALILTLVHGKDHLWRHPVRSSHKTIGRAGNGCRAEIRQFDVANICEKNVPRLDVPVDSGLRVQVV